MRDGIEVSCSRWSRQIILLMVFVAIVGGPTASAQKKQPNGPSAPKYDLQTEAKIKGTVEEVFSWCGK